MTFVTGLLLPFALIGALLVYHVARPQRNPADTSNRINKIRLVWFAMTKEELFVEQFDWLRHDEGDNFRDRT